MTRRTFWIAAALSLAVGCSGKAVIDGRPSAGGSDGSGAGGSDGTGAGGSDGSGAGGSGTGGDGASATLVYRPDIQSDLEAAGCIDDLCHGDLGVAMVVVANPTTDTEWLTNYQEVKERVNNGLLVTKAAGAFDHPTALAADSPYLERWNHWIELGAPYQ